MIESQNDQYVFSRANIDIFCKIINFTEWKHYWNSYESIAGKDIKAVCEHVSVVCFAMFHLK